MVGTCAAADTPSCTRWAASRALCNVLQPLLQASELCDVMLKQCARRRGVRCRTSKQLVFENNHIAAWWWATARPCAGGGGRHDVVP